MYTEIKFPAFERKISFASKMTFFGSCFSENIGKEMEGHKFLAAPNILGIAYNPVSIAKQISTALTPSSFDESKVIKKDERFINYDYHSSFNKKSEAEYLIHVEKRNAQANEGVLHSDFIFITFGTSIVYKLNKTGEVVNNCHKVDAKNFTKEMLSQKEMEEAMSDAIFAIQAANPKAKIILTVSPIRHLRHGATENARSKARLICSCETLEKTYDNCAYLPIYEYVMDELRDYRFYRGDDLIHLNDLGLSLVMDQFKKALIDPKSYDLMNRVGKWKQLLAHKIEDGQTEAAKKFIMKCYDETKELNDILTRRFDSELSALQLLSQK